MRREETRKHAGGKGEVDVVLISHAEFAGGVAGEDDLPIPAEREILVLDLRVGHVDAVLEEHLLVPHVGEEDDLYFDVGRYHEVSLVAELR